MPQSLAHVHCSNANIGQGKTSKQSEFCTSQNSLKGQEPRKMYIQCTSPGDGQTSCKVWLASGERRRCSNEANKRNRLKFAGVPKSGKPMSAANGPKFTILWDMWRIYCSLTIFFRLSIHALVAKYSPTIDKVVRWCPDGEFLAIFDFLRSVFSASRIQHISDLHSKFALRPHHVWKYRRHPISDGWE